ARGGARGFHRAVDLAEGLYAARPRLPIHGDLFQGVYREDLRARHGLCPGQRRALTRTRTHALAAKIQRIRPPTIASTPGGDYYILQPLVVESEGTSLGGVECGDNLKCYIDSTIAYINAVGGDIDFWSTVQIAALVATGVFGMIAT